MTTVGATTYGVVIASLNTADVPAGNICYFFCNDVQRKLVSKDNITHLANQISFATVLKQMHYTVDVRNAIVVGNLLSTLNSYHALLKNWMESTTAVYVFLKDTTGDYLEFDINGTTDDWLKCRVKEISEDIKNGKKMMNIKLEESS